jgi:TolA-binding protein
MSFDLKVKEDASLNYAKLSYEEGNPYENVADVLQFFLKTYPKSPSYEEINGLMVTSYLYQQNYQGALDYLSKNKTKQNENLIKEVSYYRGIQLFNMRNMPKALPYFEQGKYAVESSIKALSFYWCAETNYRLGNYQKSIDDFINFKKIASKESEEFQLVDYNLGYGYFKLKQYSTSAKVFQDFINTKQKDLSLVDDATIRMGDSFFAIKEYRKSIDAYKKVLDQLGNSSDYAQYQIAMCFGFLERNTTKITELESLLDNFNLSNFRDDALFQLGNTYSSLKETKKAHQAYKILFQDFPKSSYIPRALLRDGLLFYNDDENKKALKNYQEIVSNYPNSVEAREAVTNAKNVYIDLGTVDEYALWVQGISFVNITNEEIDNTTYQSAENKFLESDTPLAIKGFKKYIETFPNGLHALQANFYLAQLLVNEELYEESMKHYQYVISLPQSEFSEEALNKLSQILLEKEDWESAIPLLERLEQEANLILNIIYAQSNLMKGYYKLQDYTKSVIYAEKILLQDKIDATVEYDAKIIIARSAFQTEDYIKAEEFYTEVERNANGELKAEALYYSAYFTNKKKEYDVSNKIIQTITSDFSTYKYWGAKSFIIMAKNYYALEDSDPYQATYILENIIKNFSQFSDIINDAKSELKKIKLKESKTNNSVTTPKN